MDADLQLLQEWRDGDSAAGERLFRNRAGEIIRFFQNKVSSDQDAADLVSQTFLGLVKNRDCFRGDSSFRRFAYRVARNVLQSHLRTRYKREREQLDFASICVAELAPATPSSLLMQKREAQAFVQSLRELPLQDQIVLELRSFEGLTGPEIADALELAEGTVRGRLARATARLREAVVAKLASNGASQPASDGDLEAWAQQVRVQLGRDKLA